MRAFLLVCKKVGQLLQVAIKLNFYNPEALKLYKTVIQNALGYRIFGYYKVNIGYSCFFVLVQFCFIKKYNKNMATTKWVLDPAHSEVQFKIKHLMISTVTGSFKTINANIEANADDFENSQITLETDVNSIDTNNEQRDAHLKTADFFDAENYLKLSLRVQKWKKLIVKTINYMGISLSKISVSQLCWKLSLAVSLKIVWETQRQVLQYRVKSIVMISVLGQLIRA